MYRRKSIVIVDDNPGHLNLFKKIAPDAGPGFEFHYLHISETVPVQIWKVQHKPLLVLCNANLEGIDPIGLFYEIIKTNVNAGDFIPVVFYGYDNDQGLISSSLFANVSGFFSTPKNEADAAALLKRMIDYWSASLLPDW